MPMVKLLVPLLTVGLVMMSLPARSAVSPPLASCPSSFVDRALGFIDDYLDKSKAPGVAVAFFDNGTSCLLARGTSGGPGPKPVTPKTIFAMGSVQKVLNSTLLAY